MNLNSTSAFITGGASGLGEAAVRRLTAAGVHCTFIDINRERGEALARELGEPAQFHHADVTDAVPVAAAIDAPRRHPLRIVVNCAFRPGGQRVVSRKGDAHDLDLFRKLIEVNLIGTFNCMRLGAAAIAKSPALEDGERGVIVNTASVAAFDGQEGQTAYAAAKSAIVGMTLPAARDLKTHGIRVVTISPGAFDTPSVATAPPALREGWIKAALAPNRIGDPAEFGDFVVHVCRNSYMNGNTVRIDAGARLGMRE
jgi:NAD(P)-dependent dehydrogenase (short-subunit alcohol dehydrogenase family)